MHVPMVSRYVEDDYKCPYLNVMGHHRGHGHGGMMSNVTIPVVPLPMVMFAMVMGFMLGKMFGKKKALMWMAMGHGGPHGMMGHAMMGRSMGKCPAPWMHAHGMVGMKCPAPWMHGESGPGAEETAEGEGDPARSE